VSPIALFYRRPTRIDRRCVVAPSPAFSEHVREWTAGEFYWVLSVFWKDVQMYTVLIFGANLPDYETDPTITPPYAAAPSSSARRPLLALCSGARRFVDHS